MSAQKNRLSALIEFAQQTARLKARPVSDVSKHNIFYEYEHSLLGMPGVHWDVSDDSDEVWLRVDRLQEVPPPQPNSQLLAVVIELSNSPNKEPTIKSQIDLKTLVDIGALPAQTSLKDKVIALENFPQREVVERQFQSYLANVWKPWSEEEKRRRKTIALYSHLFTLKKQLDGDIVESQLELAWGAGVAVWKMGEVSVNYPLVTRLVELSLNESTMAIEIRPRDIEAALEIDIYSAVDNPGAADLDNAAKEFFSKSQQTFSPFDPSTFEPLLRSAVTFLDASGLYWPTQTKADDRTLPKPSDELKVTDTWVLFARPRSSSIFVQDLERFKSQLDCTADSLLPEALAAVVTDPSNENVDLALPAFRGLSLVKGSNGADGSGSTSQPAKDLFFPKPFNDEQVRIVQMLECSEGVVVQGPPGTGKTHTIANVICHYLALGKKVLVTSMRDPALAVLQEKLPPEIQPLAISLLTSEQEGMKQFEFAITKIASEIPQIDRLSLSREIRDIEANIDAYHGKLIKVEREIDDWARKNLSRIVLDDETIEPHEAAEEVTRAGSDTSWMEDPISIGAEFHPQFSDDDIVRLREARRAVGADLVYFDGELPEIDKFPDSRELLRVHQDLSKAVELQRQIDSGALASLADSSPATYQAAQALADNISNLKLQRQVIANEKAPWTAVIQDRIRNKAGDTSLVLLEELGQELEEAITERKAFLTRPVVAPNGIDLDQELVEAIENLTQGKRPFGVVGLFGKGEAKKILSQVKILNAEPNGVEDWQHVKAYVKHLRRLRDLVTRWNALAPELSIKAFPANEPPHAAGAAEAFSIYRKIKSAAALEKQIALDAKNVLPGWSRLPEVAHSESALNEAQSILLHHLTRNRLAETWAVKEQFQQALSGCSGPITQSIQEFLESKLGNPVVSDAEMQGNWTALMEELRRLYNLDNYLDAIDDITTRIEESGGIKWAKRLCTEPVTNTHDGLLPDNWRALWRLKRLATYLDSIDCRTELKRLTKQRTSIEQDLAHTYQDVITKRTWLKLAENATPDVRSALMAYLSAIAKIGKGTGKRAVRYRQDARNAAARANPAIPCWIMPHYRISESLPPEFGAFDLVIIDEASQSDLTALPALLRAKKVLVVGDDKQVSPEGVGLEEEKIRGLMERFLSEQVETYRPLMTPERSIYDLFKVVFAKSAVMLKEHFRCVAPIIEYSKREFYNHELRPLRLPKASERLDPPLIDVFVQDGYRGKNDVNQAEATFIVSEIKQIVEDPRMQNRTIGVVSMLADKQSFKIWEMIEDELGPDLIQRHKITCGDARTFQGKERDIMFLSMVASADNLTAISRDTFAQRFNVAASRARDRMYLVRSIALEDLSDKDYLRRGLITHFATPFAQDFARVDDLRTLCESPFERDVYDILTERGYRVTPQVPVGGFRIDMVVEGHNDTRLAIECDGDRYHGPDRWADDMQRQRILERAGWKFWRSFASTFYRHKEQVIAELLQALREHGIEPIGGDGLGRSVYVEQRRVTVFPLDTSQDTVEEALA